MTTNLHDKMLAAIDAHFSASDRDEMDQADEQLLDVRDEIRKHTTAAQPVPVKTYHDGKPWPVAPKPWVNLTDEEVEDLWAIHSGLPLYRAIEAKLKEKNHG
jgi:hypothetical protein